MACLNADVSIVRRHSMQFRLFQYQLPTDPELPDLNTFLGSHRVASVVHHIVSQPSGACLVFVVESVGRSSEARLTGGSSSKIDYREVLTDEEFAVFSRLRSERKRVADEEGVPVYAVLTNAQLAAIVKGRITTATALGTVEGVGKARVDKYAAKFLPIVEGTLDRASTGED